MEKITAIKQKLCYESLHLDCDKCSQLTGNQNLSEKFVKLYCDEETEEFINECHNTKYQLFKASYVVPWLLYFYSLPDANAILGTGKMFMFSTNQLKILFDNEIFENMLDIGAGDGFVTNKFKSIIKGSITCTESSHKLINVLVKNGYKIQNEIEGEFELVSCLNVLDRCDRPLSILEKILKVKKKYVLISIVLPYRGFYHDGNNKRPQLETLIEYYKNWEENVNILCKIFTEMGFIVKKISRVPYLSEGNRNKEMYFLDTAVFILS